MRLNRSNQLEAYGSLGLFFSDLATNDANYENNESLFFW